MTQIDTRGQQALSLFKARDLLTVVVLVFSLFVTYKLWGTAQRAAEQTLQTAFDFRVREASDRIHRRLAIYEQVLRATVALFGAMHGVTRDEFRNFIDALSLTETFPGIQGIGWSLLVPPAEKEKHIAAVRAEGFPNYTIRPEGRRNLYTSIVYLEPFYGRNLRAFGYDMYSEPVRRAAMEQARDTGKGAVSGKVVLVQEAGSEVQSGFLMYLPVYREGAPHATPDERRRNLVGWVYAPFRMDDFMRGLYGEQSADLDIEIYDGPQISAAAKMFDAHQAGRALAPDSGLVSVDRIEAGNRTWTVATTALEAFERRMRSDRPRLILQAGISISLMVTLLIWLFLDDRARALHAAEQALQLALYDALTGLPNRKLLEERLNQAVAKAKRGRDHEHGHVALLFIDLDKFKPINDNFGHAYGDLLLKEVARRLQSCMRESDTASRLGGDEFVALLQDIDEKRDVLAVATKILDYLSDPYEVSGHTFHISASIGAALYPEHGGDSKALIKSADLAMYDAKNSGRGNVKFAQGGEAAVSQ